MTPTPWRFLTQTATVYPAVVTQESTGAPEVAYSSSVTVPCHLQPASSRDALIYGREAGITIYDLWLAPTDSSGSATSIGHRARVDVGGVTYRVSGDSRDLCSDGSVVHVQLERET